MEEVCSHASGLLSRSIQTLASGKVLLFFFFSLLQVKYQDKDVIVREGAEANTFYIILKGEVILSFYLVQHVIGCGTFLLALCVFFFFFFFRFW